MSHHRHRPERRVLRAIGEPPGRYITLETDPIGRSPTGTAEAAAGESLSSLLPLDRDTAGWLSGQCRHPPTAAGPRSARWAWLPATPPGRPGTASGRFWWPGRRRWGCWVRRHRTAGLTHVRPGDRVRPCWRCLAARDVHGWAHCSDRRLRHRPRAGAGNNCGTLPQTWGSRRRPRTLCGGLPHPLHDLGLPTPPGGAGELAVTQKMWTCCRPGRPPHRHGGEPPAPTLLTAEDIGARRLPEHDPAPAA